jgi:hypothetical protein
VSQLSPTPPRPVVRGTARSLEPTVPQHFATTVTQMARTTGRGGVWEKNNTDHKWSKSLEAAAIQKHPNLHPLPPPPPGTNIRQVEGIQKHSCGSPVHSLERGFQIRCFL